MKRKQKLLVALFFALLTLVGLLSSGDYGLPCDEPAEQVILQENLKEYAAAFGDASAVAYYDARDVQRISESIERDHGQAAYYAAAPLLTLENASLRTVLWHAYTWLWFMVGVLSLYFVGRELGLSRLLACAGALLLYLAPRFFAEGHYNNKDVVLLSLTLATLAFGARLLRRPSCRAALWFSLAGALATNTKIIGAFAWGLIGLALLLRSAVRHELNAKRWRVGLCAIGSFLLFYAALTPAVWVDPLGYFPYVLQNATGFSRWTGVVIFKNAVYDPTNGLPLPHSYLPTMIAVTVPIATLVFAAIGQGFAMVRIVRGNGGRAVGAAEQSVNAVGASREKASVRSLGTSAKKAPLNAVGAEALCGTSDSCACPDDSRALLAVLTLLWLIPCAYVVVKQPLLYNGWRHFYFLYAGIAAMGAFGLGQIAAKLAKRRALRIVGAAALGVIFVVEAVGIAVNHPYQYGYYNALAGDAQINYELDYWDVSTLGAMKRLCSSGERDEALPLTLSARDEMSLFGVTHAYDVLEDELRARLSISGDENAPYLFFNTTYARIYGVSAPEGYHALFAVEGYGSVLCTVYERNG